MHSCQVGQVKYFSISAIYDLDTRLLIIWNAPLNLKLVKLSRVMRKRPFCAKIQWFLVNKMSNFGGGWGWIRPVPWKTLSKTVLKKVGPWLLALVSKLEIWPWKIWESEKICQEAGHK